MNITEAIKNSKRAVIPYVTAGLPDMETTGKIIMAFSDAGAAAIEIGVPFSDPMADGPVLQKASKEALDKGFTMEGLLKRLPEWSVNVKCPLIVMSYINPLMRHGLDETLARLKEAGIAGIIIPDMPSDGYEIFKTARTMNLDLIRLVAPTTTEVRRKEVLSQCSGYVYAVAVKGVTGARKALPDEVKNKVREIREMTDLPVCVGFGVSSKEQVDKILGFADGAIVASYLMEKLMADVEPVKAVKDIFRQLMG